MSAPARAPASRRPQPLIDALVPDAHLNAAVAGIRGLGLGGMRVMALGPSWTSPGLWSRQTAARAVGPSVTERPARPRGPDRAAGGDHGPLVVYPSREETIDLLLSAARLGRRGAARSPAATCSSRCATSRSSSTAAEAGLRTPGSLFEGTAASLADARFRWPVVVKPARPVSALKTARLAGDEEHLARLLEDVPTTSRCWSRSE